MTIGTNSDLCQRLRVSKNYATALRKASGYGGGGHRFDIDGVLKWFEKNPGFKMTQPVSSQSRPRKQKGRRPSTVDKADAH